MAELQRFLGVCQVVNGLRSARLGRGRRAAECLQHRALQREVIAGRGHLREHDGPVGNSGRATRLKDDDPRIGERIAEIRELCAVGDTPDPALDRMARLAVVIDEWMPRERHRRDGAAMLGRRCR